MKHRSDPHEALRDVLETLGLHLESRVIDRCLEYWGFLRDASGRLNLLSGSDSAAGPVRHIGDALAALTHWFPPGPQRLLDVGSGGGIPGIPLALAHAGIRATLLESREKKADWLLRVLKGLGLQDRVRVRAGRLEDQSPEWTATFDVMTARAVAPPERLLSWCLPLLGPGGTLLVWHSAAQYASLAEALYNNRLSHRFTLSHTISYVFESISFSSSISAITHVR